MKATLKKWLAATVCAVMIAAILAGCSQASSFDPKVLLQGNLDAQYLNKYSDEYLNSIVNTKEELEEAYANGLDYEADYFIEYFGIEIDKCDDSIKTEITDMYKEIYGYAKYEVGEVTKSDDTYLVSLTIYPIDIVQKIVDEDWEAFSASWQADDTLYDMTEEEFETTWAESVIELFKARIDTIGYLDPETISVQIVKDDDGVYTISENDFQRIDSLIIQY